MPNPLVRRTDDDEGKDGNAETAREERLSRRGRVRVLTAAAAVSVLTLAGTDKKEHAVVRGPAMVSTPSCSGLDLVFDHQSHPA